MRDYLLMNSRERERKAMLVAVAQGYINLTETSKRLCLSYRQCKRLWKRYCAEGDKGLIHGSRGKPSNRSSSSRLKQEVLRYYESQLMGFGPTLASEKLALAGYTVDHETLRRWLGEASLWKSHQRKSPYRKQRERRHCFGELVQLDGSFHDWFEDGNKHCLMNMVDDATSATQALLFDEETTEAALRILCIGLIYMAFHKRCILINELSMSPAGNLL